MDKDASIQNQGEPLSTTFLEGAIKKLAPEYDTRFLAGFSPLIVLLGNEIAEHLLIVDQLCQGVVLCDDLSNILWVSPKFERTTGFSFEDLQREGLGLLIPQQYKGMHSRWVQGFTERFRTMAERGPIEIPKKTGGTVKMIVHISSFDLPAKAQDDEPGSYRVAFLQEENKQVEYDAISKKILFLSEIIKNLGTRTVLLLAFIIISFTVIQTLPRLIRLWEYNQIEKQLNEK